MSAGKDTFQVGDIVELKSGGPPMTVVSRSGMPLGSDIVNCAWFGGRKMETGSFPAGALKRSKQGK